MNPSSSPARKDDGAPSKTPVPAAKEKRRHSRVRDSFPVTLVDSSRWFGGRALAAVARDYDVEGACVASAQPLAPGTRVGVRLRLPKSLSDFFHGLPCELSARVAASRKRRAGEAGGHEIVLKWDKPLPQMIRGIVLSYQVKIGALIALVLASVVWFKWESLDYFWYTPFFYVYSMSLIAYLLSRFYISWFHRTPKLSGYTPSLSIVISVRNEEQAIGRTVETCHETDYPADLREIIVVNDGSTDGTPKVLGDLARRFPELKVFHLPPSGKRFAMAEGVRRARGEIIVFVDSDTFLFPDSLRHIVCGFEDPTLGASAGYTAVENADANALTGLQEVRYFVSFRLLKSSESLFGCVTCCPGCLSAYRRKYVLEFLDAWLHQTFLGAPATFGDDRSLTNFILRKYRVIYNDDAVASTLVPETWGRYMRQQVRWKKSWLRETLIASGFMYRKHPVAALSFYSAAAFSLLSPVMTIRVAYLECLGHDAIFMYYVLGLVMIGLLQSLYFLYKRPSPHWLLGMLWMASSLLITGPQTYYAIATMRKNHWGTR
ncbi:MAG TPA: glycosyltransferase [Elusimicrobiota bacterium]|nr:glycosyltransferase [Elusimicrobiota bacterium]